MLQFAWRRGVSRNASRISRSTTTTATHRFPEPSGDVVLDPRTCCSPCCSAAMRRSPTRTPSFKDARIADPVRPRLVAANSAARWQPDEPGRPALGSADTGADAERELALHQAINGLRDDDPLNSASIPVVGWQRPVLWALLLVLVGCVIWQPMATAVALIGICTIGVRRDDGRPGDDLPPRPGVAGDRRHRRARPGPSPTPTCRATRSWCPPTTSPKWSATCSARWRDWSTRRTSCRCCCCSRPTTTSPSRLPGLRESETVTILLVPPAEPRTKPKACNYGLHFATGDIVTIFDAEDLPEPLQLRRGGSHLRAAARRRRLRAGQAATITTDIRTC